MSETAPRIRLLAALVLGGIALVLSISVAIRVVGGPADDPATDLLAGPALQSATGETEGEVSLPEPSVGTESTTAAVGESISEDALAGPPRSMLSARGGNRPLDALPDGDQVDAAGPQPAEADAESPSDDVGEPESPPRAAPLTYSVVPGDTIFDLAETFGISAESIMWANGLAGEGEFLQVGQELTILPVSGLLHTVQEGDTVERIASLHGSESAAIVRANNLDSADEIVVGDSLVVPGGKPAVPPVPTPEAPSPPAVAAPSPQAPEPKPETPAPAPAPRSTDKGQEIVDIASRFAGYAYTWGGHAPATGFDCTGFTWYVYGQAGIKIPLHDLWGQLSAGQRVERADLLPGDLVFFQNTYMPGLSHSALYVGGGVFIHAATEEKGVRYDRLDDLYWNPRYFGASRPW